MEVFVSLSTGFLMGTAMFDLDSNPLVEISSVDETIIKEIRYAGKDNFVGEVVVGYESEKCFLSLPAARALAKVQQELLPSNLGLKVFDCYRPQMAVDHFVRWASSDHREETKEIYFPRVPGNELFERGFIAEKSGHSRGSTVDLTIVELPYEPPSRFDVSCLTYQNYIYRGSELNMGTAFDCFDAMSETETSGLPSHAMKNRRLLVSLMEKHGFSNYRMEWWHFTYKPEPFPSTYFNFPVK